MTTRDPSFRDPPLTAPPLDYVPTAPVHKPRRGIKRGLYAAASAATAIAIGMFLPFAVIAFIALGGGWWAFCRFMADRD
ncbi:hypothetical protein [Sinorhizobium meliloti]|uniref:hypothetical protein n=1 Tax=Rhizobium meliloti TaxID=382 RepID=UPI000FD6C711|nr:hypothetical protein [Sinorhizobium meliloti]RVI59932.1 hypothetical protein CN189_23730 [Sinorhizobium meliloti]